MITRIVQLHVPDSAKETAVNRLLRISLALAAVSLLVAGCYAKDDKVGKLKVGDQAPGWHGLAGVDGKDHALDEYRQAKAIVVVFTCNHCPVAVAYEDRLVALQRDYQDKGVQVIAINVNNMPPDRLDKMKERAASKGFNFPYLYDSTQAIGHDYGARVTPHVFVLDSSRKVAYVGAIDDSKNPSGVSKNYVRDALDAILAGKEPSVAKTDAFGCGIQYQK